MSAIIRVRDNKGVVHDIPAIVGPKGDTGATGPQGPKGDTYDDSEVRADISKLKEDIAKLQQSGSGSLSVDENGDATIGGSAFAVDENGDAVI